MRKEAAKAYFEQYLSVCLQKLKNSIKNLNRNSLATLRELCNIHLFIRFIFIATVCNFKAKL